MHELAERTGRDNLFLGRGDFLQCQTGDAAQLAAGALHHLAKARAQQAGGVSRRSLTVLIPAACKSAWMRRPTLQTSPTSMPAISASRCVGSIEARSHTPLNE